MKSDLSFQTSNLSIYVCADPSFWAAVVLRHLLFLKGSNAKTSRNPEENRLKGFEKLISTQASSWSDKAWPHKYPPLFHTQTMSAFCVSAIEVPHVPTPVLLHDFPSLVSPKVATGL